jgi:hypothetical protein
MKGTHFGKGDLSHILFCAWCVMYILQTVSVWLKQRASKIINMIITVIKYDGRAVVWVVADTGGR